MIQREMQMEPTQSILALTQPPLLGIRPGIGILAALITAVNDATIINHCIFFKEKRFGFGGLQPSFSDTSEIALKSPATIHGPCMS